MCWLRHRQAVWGGRRRRGRSVGRPAGADEISCLCRKRRSFPPDRRRARGSLPPQQVCPLPCCHPQENLTSRLSQRDRGTNAQHFAVSLIPPIRDEKEGDSIVRKRKLRSVGGMTIHSSDNVIARCNGGWEDLLSEEGFKFTLACNSLRRTTKEGVIIFHCRWRFYTAILSFHGYRGTFQPTDNNCKMAGNISREHGEGQRFVCRRRNELFVCEHVIFQVVSRPRFSH